MDYIVQVAQVPMSVRRSPRPRKYPFHQLKPGMMFFAAGVKPNTMMSLASSTGKRLGWTFQTRQHHMKLEKGQWKQCDPDAKGAQFGVGVYRIA